MTTLEKLNQVDKTTPYDARQLHYMNVISVLSQEERADVLEDLMEETHIALEKLTAAYRCVEGEYEIDEGFQPYTLDEEMLNFLRKNNPDMKRKYSGLNSFMEWFVAATRTLKEL